MRVIFHVGTYKTGTSSIQNLLFRNHDALRAAGILYPTTGLTYTDEVGHRQLGLVNDYFQNRGDLFPEKLKAEIAETGCHTIVFSVETWCNPRNLPHLAAFAQVLADNGATELEAVVAFRRIDSYQVSHFRQFTIKQNKLPYPDHVRRMVGMFDYLYILRTLRSIFGSRISVLEFDPAQDIRTPIIELLGAAQLAVRLQNEPYANVRSVSALDVEAIRLCNVKGISKDAAEPAIRALGERVPWVQSTEWTERFEGDVMQRSGSYVEAFSACSGLDEWRTRRLLTPEPLRGENTSRISSELALEIERLQASTPGVR